jgi:hypothetical protein
MSERQNSSADRYRETAEEIRLAAERTRSPEIRIELFDLADHYDHRLAVHAKRREGAPD